MSGAPLISVSNLEKTNRFDQAAVIRQAKEYKAQ